MTFGGETMKNKLKEIRNSKNISGYELARKVNVTHSLIYMIENGTRNPSIKLAKKIAKVLNTSIDEIFFDEQSHETLHHNTVPDQSESA